MKSLQVNLTPTAKKTLRALQDNYPVIVNEGGARCFHALQEVITPDGPVPISLLQPGDTVLSAGGKYCRISDVINSPNKKPCVRIRMKNGKEIVCTEDHRFYFSGRWVEIKELLNLPHVYSKKL